MGQCQKNDLPDTDDAKHADKRRLDLFIINIVCVRLRVPRCLRPVNIYFGHILFLIIYWCSGRNRSFTVFTGLNVSMGTSTNIVFQSLIAPFHKPGSSSAFRSRPSLLL